jgi:hypothetical protein
LSPSQAKIFSTRPPLRGPTCTSSTSIVPETASDCFAHAATHNATVSVKAAGIFLRYRTNNGKQPDFMLVRKKNGDNSDPNFARTANSATVVGNAM